MDNNELEVVANEGLTEVSKKTQTKAIVAGAAGVIILGALAYKFLIKPAIAKKKAAKVEEAPKTEESK